jgi:hypothetical protein
VKKIEQEKKLKELYKLSDIDLLRYFKREPKSVAFYPLSKRLFTKKKFKEATQVLLNGINNHPDYIEPKILLAKLYIKTENYVEAVQSLRETIKFAPDCAESYFYLSEILFKKGINERAEILLTKAYELSPHLPDIKNSFEKRFKNSGNTTTASFNIETTVIESIDDIKKRAVKELYQDNNTKEYIPNKEEEEDILDELEREFSYKKRQFIINSIGVLVIISIIISLILSIFNKDKITNQQKNKKQLLIVLNKNIENIKKEIPNNFPDITLYYKLLYHYQINSEKYPESVTEVEKLEKLNNLWKYLSKMAYLLFTNKTDEFNKLYDIAKIKYKDNPDVFLLKGYQLLAKNDFLNSQTIFDLAYKKSNGANRFKTELASLYLNRGAFSKLKALRIEPTSLETRLFHEILRKSSFKEKEAVLLDNLSSTQNNIQKEKVAIYLINTYIQNEEFKKAEDIFNKELKNNKIPYYLEFYKHIGEKLKKLKQ